MRRHHILFFDDLGVSVHSWQRGLLHMEREFPLDVPDVADLTEFLGERQRDLFYILADLADESFQLETVPQVRGHDRFNLIERKLGQSFRGMPLKTAISLGRSGQGRRDEQLLLCALSGTARFEPWLTALRQLDAHLVGIFSLPTVIASLAGRLFGHVDRALIVCQTRSGVRHTFLDRGQLRFSRQTPLTSGAKDLASVIATESGRTYNYLIGQRLLDSESPLSILILAHSVHFEAILARLPDSAAASVRCVDLVSLSSACGLTNRIDDSCSFELWLHLLVGHPPKEQFASSEDRRCHRLGKIRLGLQAAAIAVWVISSGFVGTALWQAQRNFQGAEQLAADLAGDERELQQLVATLPSSPIGTDRLLALAQRSLVMEQRSRGPEQLLRHLGDTLNQVADIELLRLSWYMSGTLDAAMADGKLPADRMGYVVIEAQATLPPQPNQDSSHLRSAVELLRASVAGKDNLAAGTSDPRIAVDSTRALRGGTAAGTTDPLHFDFWLAQAL